MDARVVQVAVMQVLHHAGKEHVGQLSGWGEGDCDARHGFKHFFNFFFSYIYKKKIQLFFFQL